MSWPRRPIRPALGKPLNGIVAPLRRDVGATPQGCDFLAVGENAIADRDVGNPGRRAVGVNQIHEVGKRAHAVLIPRQLRKSTVILPGDSSAHFWQDSGMATELNLPEIVARIDERLKKVGLSATAASKRAGKPDAIRNMRRAIKSGDRDGVSTKTLQALAPVLETTAAWLTADGPDPSADDSSQTPELEPELILDLVRRHSQILVGQSGPELAVKWLDTLIRAVQARASGEDLHELNALRERLRALFRVARHELLTEGHGHALDASPKAPDK